MHSPCTYHLLTSDPYSCQVSEEFATISAARLLTAQNCWERILFGPRSYQLERIVARQVSCPTGRVRAPMALPSLHFPRRAGGAPHAPCVYSPCLNPAQVKRAIDEQVGLFRALLPIVVGAETFLAAKEQSVALVWGEMPRLVPCTYAYTTEAMHAEQQLRERLQARREYRPRAHGLRGEHGHSPRARPQAPPRAECQGDAFAYYGHAPRADP